MSALALYDSNELQRLWNRRSKGACRYQRLFFRTLSRISQKGMVKSHGGARVGDSRHSQSMTGIHIIKGETGI